MCLWFIPIYVLMCEKVYIYVSSTIEKRENRDVVVVQERRLESQGQRPKGYGRGVIGHWRLSVCFQVHLFDFVLALCAIVCYTIHS